MSIRKDEGDGSEQTKYSRLTYEKNATFYCETSLNEFVKEKDEASLEGDESTFNMRVRSWLRMNAGGVLNTCKSNEALYLIPSG